MAEYLAPGVFLEEKDLKAPSIEGVSTSTTGMVGHAQRGPTLGPPVLVTNMLQFRQHFGGPLPASAGTAGEMFYAAQGFFANGGRRLYVIRAAGAGAARTRFATKGEFITRLAPGSDAVVGGFGLRLASALGLRDGTNLELAFVEEGVTYASSPRAIAANGVNSATGDVALALALDIAPPGKALYPATATAVKTGFRRRNAQGVPITTGAVPDSLTLTAIDAGSWGDGIVLTSRHVSPARAVVLGMAAPGAINNNPVRLKTASGFYPLAWVQIDRGSGADKIIRQVLAVNGNVITLSGPVMNAVSVNAVAPPPAETVATVWEFAMTVSYDGVTETYPSLTLAAVTGKNVVEQINGRSSIIRVDELALPTGTDPFFFPSGEDGLTLRATSAGADAAPLAADMRGNDGGPGARTGLRALEEIEDVSILVAPGWGETSVQAAMIEQCERLKYRVALLDPEVIGSATPTLTQIQTQRLRFDTKYGAIYYPRIVIRDADDQLRAIGPAGHMAGLCARIDNERGVFKSPGNEIIRNIVDLEVIVTKGEHEILNPQPNNINVIRDFRNEGRGLRIYGARCITSLSDWKYLAVRRLFISIERSIEIGTQWAVLEPNDQRLWDRLIDSVDGYLTGLWRDGALLGVEKAHAFYIRCGTTTMTQDDIDNGRLVMEIGIAPVKPAEFVIIRISQSASGSFATEA
jgi:Bacteriophage tail sheath protein